MAAYLDAEIIARRMGAVCLTSGFWIRTYQDHCACSTRWPGRVCVRTVRPSAYFAIMRLDGLVGLDDERLWVVLPLLSLGELIEHWTLRDDEAGREPERDPFTTRSKILA